MILSLDTETTGVDFYHGARPFFVSLAFDDGPSACYRWDVDPLTREVLYLPEDVEEIWQLVQEAETIVMQNGKFDVSALSQVGLPWEEWPWDRTEDTLVAGHILASNHRHNLTDMYMEYCGDDIEPYEKKMRSIVMEARRVCRREFPDWRIAQHELADMPSVKKSSGKKDEDKAWKFDTWLPYTIADYSGFHRKHPYRAATQTYAIVDAEATLELWCAQLEELGRRGLYDLYRRRMLLPPIALRMEKRGITFSKQATKQLLAEYQRESDEAGECCVSIAAGLGYELKMPAGSGNNDSLLDFCFGLPGKTKDGKKDRVNRQRSKECLNLPVIEVTETGAPSLNKLAFEEYIAILAPENPGLTFLTRLAEKRKRDTACSYMRGYDRFALPLGGDGARALEDWFLLHPSLNQTGTDTLRWSCVNPNEQNISKKEGFNLRRCFGPAPGREWWSLDAKNIELRIFAFGAGAQALIDVFEREKEPPYYGSYHLVIFALLHPQLFNEHGIKCKDLFEATWYQWVKNGNFSLIYGAGRRKADLTYHVPGAYDLIRNRIPEIATFTDRMIRQAERLGYIETMPDSLVDPNRGYPLLVQRGDYGVVPTTPPNYFVSGSAMWWTAEAMVAVEPILADWRRKGFDGHLIMQVHDELVFDFPRAAVHPSTSVLRSNLWRIRTLGKAMAAVGDRMGVPTPVDCELHTENWSKGERFAMAA